MGDTAIEKIGKRIRTLNRLLASSGAEPLNAHRALRGALAVASFASTSGTERDVQADPETALGDLLADLMHWCDLRKSGGCALGAVDFESALCRARRHYDAERSAEETATHNDGRRNKARTIRANGRTSRKSHQVRAGNLRQAPGGGSGSQRVHLPDVRPHTRRN